MGRVVVWFAVFLLCFSLIVMAQDASVDVDSLVTDFLKIRSGSEDVGDIVTGLNSLSGDDRDLFFTTLKENSGIDFSKFGSGEFDSNGNFVLENKRVVDFVDLYNYGMGVKDASGDFSTFSYEFRGGEYSGDLPAVTDVVVEGDSLTYTFENGASIKLGKNGVFDFENRMIVSGADGKGVEWVNMKGALEVDSEGIKTKIVYDKDSETDLTGFPILKDSSGDIVSPYHGGRGVTVDLPSDFRKPSKEGMFTTFEKDGKVYSVTSAGGVREISNLEVKFTEDGEIASVRGGVIEKGELGDIFVTEETLIARGDSAPTDKSKSFIWFFEKDGNVMVSLHSVSGDLFYVQKQDLDDVSLSGNVVIKNGGYFLSSDKDGNINIRKVGGGDSKMEYGIGKLYTDEKKDAWFAIKEYEGDSEELVGKIVMYDTEGKLVLGGVFGSGEVGLIDSSGTLGVINKRYENYRTIYEDILAHDKEDRKIYSNSEGGQLTTIHEGTHSANNFATLLDQKNRREAGDSDWASYDSFYLLNGEYVSLQEPGFSTAATKSALPDYVMNNELENYLSGALGPGGSNYAYDEWRASIVATQGGIELVDKKSWNTPQQGISDLGHFTLWSLGTATMVREQKSGYWDSHPEYRNFVKVNLEAAIVVHNKALSTGYTQNFFLTDNPLNTFSSANDARSTAMRRTARELLGSENANRIFGFSN